MTEELRLLLSRSFPDPVSAQNRVVAFFEEISESLHTPEGLPESRLISNIQQVNKSSASYKLGVLRP